MALSQVIRLFTFLSWFSLGNYYFESQLRARDHCFCKLKERINHCSCNVDTVDNFNNMKIYPRLSSLLNKDYFRFYMVNLKQKVPILVRWQQLCHALLSCWTMFGCRHSWRFEMSLAKECSDRGAIIIQALQRSSGGGILVFSLGSDRRLY
jgi:hypothetical protein